MLHLLPPHTHTEPHLKFFHRQIANECIQSNISSPPPLPRPDVWALASRGSALIFRGNAVKRKTNLQRQPITGHRSPSYSARETPSGAIHQVWLQRLYPDLAVATGALETQLELTQMGPQRFYQCARRAGWLPQRWRFPQNDCRVFSVCGDTCIYSFTVVTPTMSRDVDKDRLQKTSWSSINVCRVFVCVMQYRHKKSY